MGVKISLAGDLGSGKSTVSKILMEKLNAEYYSTGAICRKVAEEHGMTVVEMNLYMETHKELDKEIDDGLVALSDREENLIIDSRMAFHFVKGSFRVYMTTELAESAKRVFRDNRVTENFSTLEETENKLKERKESERRRYFDLYGVDCKDLRNYDLVVDTTYASPEEVAACIMDSLAKFRMGEGEKFCYICPMRFLYSDKIPDLDRAQKLSDLMDEGESDIGTVETTECDGTFYLTRNTEVALAYSLSDIPLVPCHLTVGQVPKGNYVSMRDSL